MTSKKDLIWKGIIEDYIPDGNSDIAMEETDGLICLAVYESECYPPLDIYTGKSYKEVFLKTGYLQGLWESCEDLGYSEDAIKEINRAMEEVWPGVVEEVNRTNGGE